MAMQNRWPTIACHVYHVHGSLNFLKQQGHTLHLTISNEATENSSLRAREIYSNVRNTSDYLQVIGT